jgi:Fic family protein
MENMIDDLLKTIDELNSQINEFRPLNREQELRLIQKLRLDWNYHSCNIEGNTLTYGETKDLLFWGITAKGKPFKDHIELKGHNQAIEWIFDIVKDKNRPLNENFIRELHSLIIAPDSYSNAETPEGLPIKKLILRGEFKKTPNHVRTKTGEMFYFASPEETPAKMQELIEWFRITYKENKTHPLILASLFHYKFVRIHPFDDGNGRMSRILMNFILMMFGLPPVVIPTNEKSNYILALEYADKENLDNFVQYIGEKLIASLELVLKAAKGESVEDETDLDKMLLMLDKRIENIDESKGITKERNSKTQLDLFEMCFEPLNNLLFTKLEKFNKYFNSIDIVINNQHRELKPKNLLEINTNLKYLLNYTNYPEIKILYTFSSLTKLGLVHYDLPILIILKFEKLYYKIGFGYIENKEFKIFNKFEKLYHQIIYSDEIQSINKQITEYLIEKIESEIGKLENGK